ncbi:MAG: MFS transporter [Microbacteriaceae bacterium]|nr:MFS transporter [Microbacteriaceae bacterium]
MVTRRKASSAKRRPSMFRTLRVPNFRTWMIGALLANIGGWAQRTAQDWLVLTELTDNDAVALGFSLALQFGPILILGPILGLLADRLPARTIIFWCAVLETLFGIILGVAVILGVANLFLVYALALALGVVQAVEAPARHVFVNELVAKKSVPNAIGLHSTMFNSSRLVGPALAGIGIALLGTGWTLLLSGLSLGAAAMAIAFLRRHELHAVEKAPKERGQFRAGMAYIGSRKDLLVVLAMLFVVGALVFNFGIFSSTMAVVEFGLGAQDYGFIMSALAVGSLGGAVLVARSSRPRLSVITVAALVIAIGGIASALAPTVTVFVLVYPLLGFGGVLMVATTNGYIQTTTDDIYRGRVMAIFSTLLIGSTPIGSPLIGWVSNQFGPRWALGAAALGGLIATVIALVWMRSSHNISTMATLRSAFARTTDEQPDTATQIITIGQRGP